MREETSPRCHSWLAVIPGLGAAREPERASSPPAGVGGREQWAGMGMRLLCARCHRHTWPVRAGPRPGGLGHTESHWTQPGVKAILQHLEANDPHAMIGLNEKKTWDSRSQDNRSI